MSEKEKELLLIADDDSKICDTIAGYMGKKGYSTITAYNGISALKIFKEAKPSLAIIDIQMPGLKGINLLKEIRKFDSITPVIIITGYPDMSTAIEALHNGAYDYVIKPFQMELLNSKVFQALKTQDLTKRNAALSELVSLHDISIKLANTHDLSEVLDLTFQFCVDTLYPDKGSILLYNSKRNTVSVLRKIGIRDCEETSSLSDKKQWPVSKWVIKNKCSILISEGKSDPKADITLLDENTGSFLSVPLKAEEKVIGVVNMFRDMGRNIFTDVDLSTLEVLASQAGTAINNANLYSSLNQKLTELSLISNYSERFLGMVDLTEVIKCLFETVQNYFQIDIIGFLNIKKRFHKFLYWSSENLSKIQLDKVIVESVNKYNTVTKTKIENKRITPQFMEIAPYKETSLSESINFTHIIPLVGEGRDDANFGVLYFGARNIPDKLEEKISLLESLVSQTRIALTSAKLYSDIKENYIRTIKALAIAVDAKDTYTHGHSENVMNIAEAIAEEMKMDEKMISTIRDGGLLHDIGKIGIPGYILNKPGPLTSEEYNGVMKTHSTLGANIIKDVPFLKDLYSLILHHHEHHNGSGYPSGLKGNEIPIGARIVHVADAFEAMTSDRPYRVSLGKKEALRRLRENKGKEFDPGIVDAFIRLAKNRRWVGKDD